MSFPFSVVLFCFVLFYFVLFYVSRRNCLSYGIYCSDKTSHRVFQASQGYDVRLCLKKKKKSFVSCYIPSECIDEWYVLSCSSEPAQFAFLEQDNLFRSGTAYSKLGPSHINYQGRKYSHTLSQGHLVGTFSQLTFPLPKSLQVVSRWQNYPTHWLTQIIL